MSSHSCPICGKAGQNLPIEHGEDYTIYHCSLCLGDFAETQFSVDYQQEYQTGELSLKRLSQPVKELEEAKLFAHFTQALKFLNAFPSRGRLLNVTRATPVFSKLAEGTGFEVYTLCSVPEAITYAREGFGLKNAMAGSVDDTPPGWNNFDFVTCFEVLEHVGEPRELSNKIYELLAPGGYFIVSAPNRNRLSVVLGRRDAHDYPPNHMTRWSKEVLYNFLGGLGFTDVVVKIDGMERWDLTTILFPNRFNDSIVRRKINGLSSADSNRREFFIHSPIWRLAQSVGDAIASAMGMTIGKRYGTFLIGFGQRPFDGIKGECR